MGEVWVPKVMLGVPLTDGQFKSIVEGKATWVEGMTPPQPKQQGEKQVVATDAKGEKFNAWVKPNQVEGKLKFYKWNPDRSKKVTPANESKTQVAVNSHGKTNEATKHVKEPLKQGQQKPTEQQQRRFYKKPAGKSTGHKM